MIPALVRAMRRNISDNLDVVLAIQGAEGSGKSNLAYQICKAYDPNFDIASQYVYSVNDLRQKLKEGDDRHKVFWLDEGSNIANNRNWQTQDNKDIVELLEMMRSRQWILVFCIPTIERLDVYIREYRLRYVLTCKHFKFQGISYPRGLFEVYAKNSLGKIQYVGVGSYNRIPEGDKEIYEQIKLASQQQRLQKFMDNEDKNPGAKYKAKYEDSQNRQNRAIYLLTKDQQKYIVEEIARAYGMNPQDNAFKKAKMNGKKLVEAENEDQG